MQDMKRLKWLGWILILITAVVCLSSCQKSEQQQFEEKRKTAESLIIQRKYAEAAEELESLDGNESAAQLARYCRGLEAGEQGEYEKAAGIFRSLSGFRDSDRMYQYYTARKHETDAQNGTEQSAEDYITAAKAYQQIPSYRDSAARAEACLQTAYAYAVEQAELKYYDRAEKIFTLLENYLDSWSLARKAKADGLYESGNTEEAFRLYRQLTPEYRTHTEDELKEQEETMPEPTTEPEQNTEEPERETAVEATAEPGKETAGKTKPEEEPGSGEEAGTDNEPEETESPESLQENEYQRALKLLEEEKFDEAAAVFSKLGDYMDCEMLVLECSYQKAITLAEEQKYREAAELFESLQGYRNSRTYLEKIKADQLFDSGDFAGAWLIYLKLEEELCPHLEEYEVMYAAAGEAYENGRFEEAKDQYLRLGTYRDSAACAEKCRYEMAKELLAQRKLEEASDLLSSKILNNFGIVACILG